MKLKLIKTLKLSKSQSHNGFITPIEKGTFVEYYPENRSIDHPNVAWNIIISADQLEKYFEQIFKMKTERSLAGKGEIHTAKEWKRIYGYELRLVAGAEFLPILI